MVLGDGGHDDWVLVRPTIVSDSRLLFYLPHVLGDHLPHRRSDSAKPRAHAPPMVKRHAGTIGEDHVCCFEACRYFDFDSMSMWIVDFTTIDDDGMAHLHLPFDNPRHDKN